MYIHAMCLPVGSPVGQRGIFAPPPRPSACNRALRIHGTVELVQHTAVHVTGA